MDAPTSPVVDVQTTDAPRGGPLQLEDSPDVEDQLTPINDDAEEQPHKTATGPMQKRRRVTRAWYVEIVAKQPMPY